MGRGDAAAGPARVPRVCLHCGLPCRAPAAGPAFCCAGCEFVWSLTADEGDPQAGAARVALSRLVLGAFFTMNVMAFSLVLYGLPEPAADAGARVFRGAFRVLAGLAAIPALALLGAPLAAGVGAGNGGGTDRLILLAVGAAVATSAAAAATGRGHVYFDTACMTLLLLQVGRTLTARARADSGAAIRRAADAAPATATLVDARGSREVPLDAVDSGDVIRVAPGGVAPLDGRVEGAGGTVDVTLVTGESEPAPAPPGARVFAGSRNLGAAPLTLRVHGPLGERLIDEMDRLMTDARARGGGDPGLDGRAAALFAPAVALLASGAATYWAPRAGVATALQVALAVLLCACPCALGVAAPLARLRGFGFLSRRGVAVKDGGALERLGTVTAVFLDKTGTLTLPGDRAGPEALRPGAAAAVAGLRELGLTVRVLSGDRPARVELVAAALGVEARAGMLPHEKTAAVEAAAAAGPVLYVGDGFNDAPGLAAAAVGVAIGGGSELSTCAADLVLLRSDLGVLPDLVRLGRAVRTRVRRNLAWVFAYNAALLTLAVRGALHPAAAALAMIASSLTVVAASAAPIPGVEGGPR